MKVFCDSSVLVAGCVAAHPHFPRAVVILQDVAAGTCEGYCSAHSLAEVFSALTSIPVQPRITPSEASSMIRQNIQASFKLLCPSTATHEKAVEACVSRGLFGGIVYDALLIETARSGAFDRIYTFNIKHYRSLAPDLIDRIAAP
ncbi:MAG TPA: PIN domain-containing protein [Kiritimatiellia bacterium]|nr:PIN domain-containing protein [Kiritimatiellia bacterium]